MLSPKSPPHARPSNIINISPWWPAQPNRHLLIMIRFLVQRNYPSWKGILSGPSRYMRNLRINSLEETLRASWTTHTKFKNLTVIGTTSKSSQSRLVASTSPWSQWRPTSGTKSPWKSLAGPISWRTPRSTRTKCFITIRYQRIVSL